MDCPDVDMLISFARAPGRHGAVRAHVWRCARCSDEVRLLRALVDVTMVLEPIPERLVDRVLGALPGESSVAPPPSPMPDFLPGHSALTFVMAVGTTMLAVLLTGDGASASLATVGAVSVVGAATALIEPRVLKL